jgi:hypothetical protein
MSDIISEFQNEGGIVTVVSHSESHEIVEDYRRENILVPELVFGWELGLEKIKPSTYPVDTIINNYDLDRSEILVLDDLRPGLEMANKAKVPFATAGWVQKPNEIKKWMRDNSEFILIILIALANIFLKINGKL